jgi:hypothetical protein
MKANPSHDQTPNGDKLGVVDECVYNDIARGENKETKGPFTQDTAVTRMCVA